MKNNQIDAVVTWVDGQDPHHRQKILQHLNPNFSKQENNPELEKKYIDPARFHASGEIDYCIRSLLKYAPWLHKIYIVTDAQCPKIIDDLRGTSDEKRVCLIDHREIFRGFEEYLPTFNSLSIETVLWRIPGLAENFIYCNDDLFILRDVSEEDFFRGDKIVLRGKWTRQHAYKWWKNFFKLKAPDEHRLLQERSATLANFKTKFLHLPHAPIALHKSTFKNFFAKNPDLLRHNISFPLRDRAQFWPISLMQHLEFSEHQAILDNKKSSIMINGACHSRSKQDARLTKLKNNHNVNFLCIQGMDVMSLARQQQLWHILEKEPFLLLI